MNRVFHPWFNMFVTVSSIDIGSCHPHVQLNAKWNEKLQLSLKDNLDCALTKMKVCPKCNKNKAQLKRPKTGELICKECFFAVFEYEIHQTISSSKLFKRGERVAIAASGGKDSTVLAHVMKTLNDRYDYGLDLFLLSIDEGAFNILKFLLACRNCRL